MGEIISKEELKEKRQLFRKEGKKVVLCHGVFDLIHPGHIIHLEEAKKLGDILVVSITMAEYVRKGPGRPYFNDELRMKSLAALSCVDYVVLSDGYTVDDVVESLQPDLYVKGKEYEQSEKDITGKISEESALVEKNGGKICFTEGEVYSSTKLLNNVTSLMSEELKNYMQDFSANHSMEQLLEWTDKISRLKVLVVGDVIIDKYDYCYVQGLMSKDMGYSARFLSYEEYLGGSLAVAGHAETFLNQLTLMSVIGNEAEIHSRLLNQMSRGVHLDMIYSEEFSTIIKKRYITQNEKREELHKVFSVTNLKDPMIIDKKSMSEFAAKLNDNIENYDLVIVCDFGHGLIDDTIKEILETKAKFLAVNCQTNSSNFGRNIITKYKRADAFALDQKELKLAYPSYDSTEEDNLISLSKHFPAEGWLTRGSMGAYGVSDGNIFKAPAFTLQVMDTIGAGDAFFTIASLYKAVGAPVEVGTFVGNIAGALAANIVGNKATLDKVDILKYAKTLLNI